MTPAALRRVLREAFARALAAVDLEERVAAAMPRVPRDAHAGAIVALGKAAPAMARGALRFADERFARVLVVAPDGTEATLDDERVELLRAAHPDPDARSVAAARRALAVVREADFVVALLSGGASSLVCLPEGTGIARYVRVVRALLVGGASVTEVNVVRRHLCAVKGGGLAQAAGGPVRTLVASDVIGGAAYDVGLGTDGGGSTKRAQARAVLARYAGDVCAGDVEGLRLRESLKAGAAAAKRLRVRVVAGPEDLARVTAAELRRVFAMVRVLRASQASAIELAREYVLRARALAPGEALVRAAEPSVVVDVARPGRGGRATHVAALVARELALGVAFLAGASDGVDGASWTAGAVVDASIRARLPREALERAVAGFDTGPLLGSAGMTIPFAPSGTNFADVHVLARG